MKKRGTNKDEPSGKRVYRLTPAGLASLRATVRRTKPWLRATGPTTPAGKHRASRNALRHGLYSAESIARKRQSAELLRIMRQIAPATDPSPQGGTVPTF